MRETLLAVMFVATILLFTPIFFYSQEKQLELSSRADLNPGSSSSQAAPSPSNLIANYTWAEVGPKPISSQAPFTTFGTTPMSARISAIAINSTDTMNIFVGSAHGGVWKTTDGGATWNPLTDSQASLATGAITLSPDQKTIYVGTGEPNHSGETYYGQGLLKSSDGGRTWSTLGLKYFGNSSISSILVQSTNPSRILVSTTWGGCCILHSVSNGNPLGVGVYLSLDGGASWPDIFQTAAMYPKSGFAQLLADPSNSNIVYAGDFNGTVWRSMDFGSTWARFASYSTAGLQGRVALATTPAKPGTLFAAYSNAAGELNGIFSYDTTSLQNATLSMPPGTPLGSSPCNGQCNYDLVLVVNPTNPNILYFGAVDLYLSTNAGASWTDLGGLWYPQQSTIHPDQHAFVFVPGGSGSFLIGNDGGIWESANQGSTWTNLNAGLGISELYSLALSPSSSASPNIIVGSQDQGLLAYSNPDWSQRLTGDVGFTGFEPRNPSIAYLYVYANFYKSSDGGNTWNIASTGLNISDIYFLPPVAQDPNNPGVLYLGGTHVYKTLNYAQSWTDASGTLSPAGVITAMAVAPSNSSILYLGDSNGLVRVSTDSGLSWTTVLSTIPRSVTSMAVDPTNSSKVYVSFARRQTPIILASSNQGMSWTILPTIGLPPAAVNELNVQASALLAGTDSGLYFTNNVTSWARLGRGLPMVPVTGIARMSNDLYVSTLGRGVWKVRLTPLPGDANGDCRVDIFDLVIVGAAFGSTPSSGSWNPQGDLDSDGRIDIFDLVIVGSNFAATC
jgi:photosystem II stability/assembly factor-like uncharacterized protein